MTERPGIGALQREWTIGLAVVIGGFVIAIAVAAFLTFGAATHAVVPDETQRAEAAPATGAQNGLEDPGQVCSTALANAKNDGVIPHNGRLADLDPRQTDRQGRFICDAAAGKSKYAIAADITCSETGRSQCISIYTVSQDDGSVLYQRQR